MAGVRPIVGREAELAQLSQALAEAGRGRGSVWFVSGEPGIGKTRLVEELAEQAARSGVSACFGRCWEAGGAPAYWPWMEVLRALLRGPAGSAPERALRARAQVLSQLLPELGDTREAASAPAHVGGERGRFELLDALAQALCDATREAALLVVVEDLHVADEATVSVLTLLNQQARASQLLVVGTLRDADARLAHGGGELLRLTQGPRRIELERLGTAHVEQLLAQSGSAPSAATRDAVQRVTEGNPLFLVEISRLLSGREWATGDAPGVAIPRSVRHAIRARLERLSPRARATLEVASVLGRQFRAGLLAQLAQASRAELDEPLSEALDAGILSEVAPEEYRFSHVLLREVLHLDTSEQRRAALHREAAAALQLLGSEARWSEIAHHLLEAGPEARDAAIDASRRAAMDSSDTLAFPDAVEHYTRALGALGRERTPDDPRRGPLLLALAEAQLQAGTADAGQASCRRVAELARQRGDGELLARAALGYGTVLRYAVVDPTLVELLREALAALPEGPSRLRAVVMARLAAAEQPAPEPEQSFEQARAAIAMARAQHDPDTLLETMRYAISALMDLASPSERLALNREYVRLACARGVPLEELRGTLRQTFDQLELGDLSAMVASIESVERLTRRFGHPFFAWRVPAFRAMLAIFAGQFAEAERHLERARELGQAGRDASAETTLTFQRHLLLRSQGRDDEVLLSMPSVSQLLQGSELGQLSVRIMTAEALLRAGREQQAAAHVGPQDLLALVRYGDVSTFPFLASVVLALGLGQVVTPALGVLDAHPRLFASGGMATMCAGEPVALIRGTLLRAAGRHAEAEQQYELAAQHARQVGAEPFAAWARLEQARLLLAHFGGERQEQARGLGAEVLAAAARLGAPGLEQRARALLAAVETGAVTTAAAVAAPPRSAEAVGIERDGESWLVCCGEVRLRLADSKGMGWLAQLVNEPGREFHVLDLSGAAGADGGDAGEVLDVRARQQYRERLSELESELAEADAHNDAGRAARLREELELLRTELSRALGIGGRERRSGSAAERARINVQRRLRDALDRITLQHADLGHKLKRALKTGLFCSYRP